jgi:hypothetical protein
MVIMPQKQSHSIAKHFFVEAIKLIATFKPHKKENNASTECLFMFCIDVELTDCV